MKTVFVNREQAGKLVTPGDLNDLLRGYRTELLLTTGAKLILTKVSGGTRLAVSGYAADGSDVDSIIDNDEALSYKVIHKTYSGGEEVYDIYTADGVYVTTVDSLEEARKTLGSAKYELIEGRGDYDGDFPPQILPPTI